jgi:hypothetical protein
VRLTEGLFPAAIVPVKVPVPDTGVVWFTVPTRASVPDSDPPFCVMVRLNVEFRATPCDVPVMTPV